MVKFYMDCACQLNAHTPTQRKRHQTLLTFILEQKLEMRETALGYIFVFPAHPDTLLQLAEFVWLEGLCCPFLDFAIRFETTKQAVQLEVMGEPEAKPAILANFMAAIE